jgi:hypothetical protein
MAASDPSVPTMMVEKIESVFDSAASVSSRAMLLARRLAL